MAQFSFNSLLDRWKQRWESILTESTFRDNFLREITHFADFKLTAAQLDTGNATPVEVLPAPGAGLANVIMGIATFIDAGATPFELGSGTLGYLLTDGSGAAVATAVPNASVESATDVYYWSVPLAVAPLVNAKVVAKPSADVTAGDGAIYGRIFYKTIKVSEFATGTQIP